MNIDKSRIELVPRTFSQIIDISLVFFRVHFAFFFKVSFWWSLPITLFLLTLQFLSSMSLYWFIPAVMIFLILTNGALTTASGHLIFQKDLKFKENSKLFKSNFRKYLLAILIYRYLPALVCFFLFVVGVLLLKADNMVSGVIIITLFIIIFFPALLFINRYLFLPEVILLENLDYKQAKKRTLELIKYYSARWFSFNIILSFVQIILLYSLFSLYLFVLGQILEIPGYSSQNLIYINLSTIDYLVICMFIILINPVIYICHFFSYLDTRIRKDGWDLEIRSKAYKDEVDNLNSIR